MTPSCLSWADLALKRLGQRVIFLCKIVHARVAVGKKAVHLDLRRAFICRDIKTVPRLGMWLVSDGCQVVPNGCQMVCMGWPSPWVVVGVRWVSGGARWVSDGVHGLALDLGWVRVAFGVGVRLSIIPSSDHIIPIYGHMIMHYTHIWSYDPIMPIMGCLGVRLSMVRVTGHDSLTGLLDMATGQDFLGRFLGRFLLQVSAPTWQEHMSYR